MRIALLLIFFLGTFTAFSQLSYENIMMEKSISPGDDDVSVHNRIINDSDQPVRARWIREVNDLPSGWASAVCDTNRCYLPQIDSADFILSRNSSAPIIPHVYPDGSVGDAQITVRVIDIDNRSNSAVATFSFPFSSSTNNNTVSSAKIYPNPAANVFSLVSDKEITEVSVTNMLGKLVRVYPGSSSSYDVSDLANGIYLVSMKDNTGKVFKTLRFSKRAYRP